MRDLTIGQLVDTLKDAYIGKIGVDVRLDMSAWVNSQAEAERVAILMAQELGGTMSEEKAPGLDYADQQLRWYNITNRAGRCIFTTFWLEKETATPG